MLEDLNSSIRLVTQHEVPDLESIHAFRRRFGSFPDYEGLIREAGEIELMREDDQYIRIWAPERCVNMDEGYDITRQIPGAFPIGDDGGCTVILYMEGAKGWGLYLCRYEDLDRDEARFMVSDLRRLLVDAEGWSELWNY